MKHTGRRIILVVIEACIGLGAIGGGLALLIGAMGQWLPAAFLQGTPFSDYLIPGLVLTVVVGGGMLLVAATQFMQCEWVVLLSAAMGFIMIGWEIVEVTIIDRYAQAVVPSTVAQQVLFAVLGLIIIGLSASLWMTEYRGEHGKDSKAVQKSPAGDYPSRRKAFFTMITACLRQGGRRMGGKHENFKDCFVVISDRCLC